MFEVVFRETRDITGDNRDILCGNLDQRVSIHDMFPIMADMRSVNAWQFIEKEDLFEEATVTRKHRRTHQTNM